MGQCLADRDDGEELKHTKVGGVHSTDNLSIDCTPPILVSISSSPSPLSAELCPSIRSRVRILQPSQQAEAHIIHYRYILEGHKSMSVRRMPTEKFGVYQLLSIICLHAKLCPMSVHRSFQELELVSS